MKKRCNEKGWGFVHHGNRSQKPSEQKMFMGNNDQKKEPASHYGCPTRDCHEEDSKDVPFSKWDS